jgi:hypothetical protein
MTREEFIAEVRHAVWVGYQIGVGQEFNLELNDDQRRSLYDGIRFADANPNRTPESNHENWMRCKIEQGWKYGPIKSFELKEHPDLVPFNDLPEVEQRKDIMDFHAHNMAVKLWDMLLAQGMEIPHKSVVDDNIGFERRR